ncbi:MAG: peptidase S41 [Caulobacterales bacterium]|nr:peptidase S41 [Caulobacterales bacterium]
MKRLSSALFVLAVMLAQPVSAQAPSPDRARLNQRVFDRVWNEVRRTYYDPHLHGVDWDAARQRYRPQALAAADDRQLYRALSGMLDLLDDDHAGAQSPASVRRQERLRQRRAVIGFTLAREEGETYRVEQVRAGSPADEAGIGLGWRLRSVDGRDWGPEFDLVEGRPVTLTLIDDNGVERETVVTPRVMEPVPAFSADRSHPGVLVLRAEGFEAGLGRWVAEQLRDLPPETDVVLDLRGNPGGRLMEVEAVLACFLPNGEDWARRTGRTGRVVLLRTETGCGGRAAPVANDLAVLVDGFSRSAAELTPAALQQSRRAVVVGEKTAGAVLISQDTNLPDGGRLSLSRADLIMRDGRRLEKNGLTPDAVVARTVEDRRAGRDPQLEAAIRLLSENNPLIPAETRVSPSRP